MATKEQLKKHNETLGAKLRKLRLVVKQEITHLKALTQIPAIAGNHHIIGSLDLSIFKLWDESGKDE